MDHVLRAVGVLGVLALAVIGAVLYDGYYVTRYERERERRAAAEEQAERQSDELERALARAETAQRLAERKWMDSVAALVTIRQERDALAAQLDRNDQAARLRELQAECERLRSQIERLRRENETLRDR